MLKMTCYDLMVTTQLNILVWILGDAADTVYDRHIRWLRIGKRDGAVVVVY